MSEIYIPPTDSLRVSDAAKEEFLETLAELGLIECLDGSWFEMETENPELAKAVDSSYWRILQEEEKMGEALGVALRLGACMGFLALRLNKTPPLPVLDPTFSKQFININGHYDLLFTESLVTDPNLLEITNYVGAESILLPDFKHRMNFDRGAGGVRYMLNAQYTTQQSGNN